MGYFWNDYTILGNNLYASDEDLYCQCDETAPNTRNEDIWILNHSDKEYTLYISGKNNTDLNESYPIPTFKGLHLVIENGKFENTVIKTSKNKGPLINLEIKPGIFFYVLK